MDSNDKQEILQKTLYSYIGFNNVEKINNDISGSLEEIKNIEIPETLDLWFEEFNNKLENKEAKKRYKNRFKSIVSKVAIIFLILSISLAILTVAVEAFRIRLFNIIIENRERFLDVEVNEESNEDGIKKMRDTHYELGYIPAGFTIDYAEEFGHTKVINYINENNEEILFNQSPNGTNFQLDSEDALVKEIKISDSDAIMLNKEGRNTLFWYNEEYSFYLLSTIDEKELISIGENIVRK